MRGKYIMYKELFCIKMTDIQLFCKRKKTFQGADHVTVQSRIGLRKMEIQFKFL